MILRIVVAGSLLLCVGCKRGGIAAPTGGNDLPPSKVKLAREVLTAPVEQRDLLYTVDTVGSLEPEKQTAIAPGVAGIVDEVLFKEGDQLDPDTVLVRIDQEKYQSAAALAKANQQRAEARLALAKDFASRSASLTQRQAGAQEEATKWALEYEAAKAELAAAQAARALAERDLAKSRVRPPYPGQINQRSVAPGEYVKEETVIATIADISKLRLVTWIPEMAAARVKVGDMLEYEVPSLPNKRCQARIFYLSTVADTQSHMFECKAEITEPDAAMKPGLFARVQIATEKHADACVVPEESVRAGEKGFLVYVPHERPGPDGQPQWVAKARRVQLGFRRPGFVEVLSGVEPGERVITRGSEALEDGTPVEFLREEQKTEVTAEAERNKNGKT
jgi:RND family efflux transporter MFP subunit